MIYLSGPISLDGKASPEQIAQYKMVFKIEAERLRNLNYDVFNPIEIVGNTAWGWTDYMRVCLKAVTDSYLVAILPDWFRSRGSCLEVYLATQLNIPIHPVEQIINWDMA